MTYPLIFSFSASLLVCTLNGNQDEVYQSRKVDTENVFNQFLFSKVDTGHIFADNGFSKVDI